MEAPEKIYMRPILTEDGESIMRRCAFRKDEENTIEYTRTDAFVEKAWSWIEDNILSSNQQDKSPLYYEQLKKYLEE